MRELSGHQPVYLPGIIFFDKLAKSDGFMFVGHCDYQPKSWQSHNFIRQGDNQLMLSVPVHKADSINATAPMENGWRRKHLASITHAYGKRPFFDLYFDDLRKLLVGETLSDLNCGLIRWIAGVLGITTPILDSRDFQITGHKTDMLISMCGATGALGYLSSPGERSYVDQGQMKAAGLSHRFQEFNHPVYDQGRKFIPNLSVIDLLFNCGPASVDIVRGADV